MGAAGWGIVPLVDAHAQSERMIGTTAGFTHLGVPRKLEGLLRKTDGQRGHGKERKGERKGDHAAESNHQGWAWPGNDAPRRHGVGARGGCNTPSPHPSPGRPAERSAFNGGATRGERPRESRPAGHAALRQQTQAPSCLACTTSRSLYSASGAMIDTTSALGDARPSLSHSMAMIGASTRPGGAAAPLPGPGRPLIPHEPERNTGGCR